MVDSWEYCVLDDTQMNAILNYETKLLGSSKLDENVSSSSYTHNMSFLASESDYEVQVMKEMLSESETSCHEFLDRIDEVLQVLSNLSSSYSDVTGRTNTLMRSCEDLLEQQQKIQSTMESLKEFLIPFNDIEDVSALLGIPVDFRAPLVITSSAADLTIDPRSSEFQNILVRLSHCQYNLKQHNTFKDYDKYQKLLDQLQNRATSLVVKSMRELLENASKTCTDLFIKNQLKGIGGYKPYEDQPLESAPIYQKFRGLGFRMRELSSLLQIDDKINHAREIEGNNNNNNNNNNDDDDDNGDNNFKNHNDNHKVTSLFNQERIVNDVKQAYVVIRNTLLQPFIKEVVLAGLKHRESNKNSNNKSSNNNNNNNNGNNNINLTQQLCHGIRQAFSSLLRIAQLEQHLFMSLFILPAVVENKTTSATTATRISSEKSNSIDNNGSDKNNDPSSSSSSLINHTKRSAEISQYYHVEVLSIIENVNNIIVDYIRPLIISESDIDELCRIIITLSEDIRNQFSNVHASQNLITLLLNNLDRVIFDSQERLSYCAENDLRITIQFFEPLPSQIAFPDILEKFQKGSNSSSNIMMDSSSSSSIVSLDSTISKPSQLTETDPTSITTNTSNNTTTTATANDESTVESISKTWYPPLRNTLSLLSKLYGIVDMIVFEDFARRSVRLCMQILIKGSEIVKRRNVNMQIHGDLFLIRHLLLLREQLLPFEIKLQSVERSLDFKNTRNAINNFAQHPRNLIRFDNYNALLQLAREGLPATLEKQVDAKQELDGVLRTACVSFKQNALKLLLNPIITFLTKVEAFAGDIPINMINNKTDTRKYIRNNQILDDKDSTNTVTTKDTNNITTVTTTNTKLAISEDDDMMLPIEVRNNLKNQSFIKSDRIKELLENSHQLCVQCAPELRDFLKLYVENQFARSVLMKPVQQEIELTKKKMQVVIFSCVDAGSAKRALEQLLHSVLSTALSELNK